MRRCIEMEPPSAYRHITFDSSGNMYDVPVMFDRCASRTDDPALAVSCVIDLGAMWHTTTTDNVPIYTVH